jgi:hypothetical protein
VKDLPKWRPSWPFLLGVLATVVLTVIAAVVTSTTANLSIVIALLGLAVTLILDLISRVERRQETTTMAFRIAEAVERMPDAAPDLEKAVLLASDIVEGGGGKRFRDALTHAASEFRDDLEALSRGDLRVHIGSGSILSEETDLTRTTIRATSVVTVDEAWWSSEAGKEYAQASAAAMRRGVSITRIYIFDREQSTRMQILMKEQRAMGTHVYAIDLADVPLELRINVVIFDERAVYAISETGDPKNPLRMLHTQPHDVQTAIRRFEQLLQLIMQLDSSRS